MVAGTVADHVVAGSPATDPDTRLHFVGSASGVVADVTESSSIYVSPRAGHVTKIGAVDVKVYTCPDTQRAGVAAGVVAS